MYFNKIHSYQPPGCCTGQDPSWRCLHRAAVQPGGCGGGAGALWVQEGGILPGGDTVGLKQGVGAQQ